MNRWLTILLATFLPAVALAQQAGTTLGSGSLPAGIKSSAGNPIVDTAGTATLTNKNQTSLTNTFYLQVNCTNGSTGASDAALLAAAATTVTSAGGGKIDVMTPCTVNATTTVGSNTVVDLHGNTMTAAAAANWSGSAIAPAFSCADSATDITWQNGYYNWTGAAASVKVITCNGEVDSVSYSRLAFYNNTCNLAPGDCIALVHVTGAKLIGNKCYQPIAATSAGACFDLWDNDFDIEESDNSAYVASQGIGFIFTGFQLANEAKNVRNLNAHNNYCEAISSANGTATCFYNQGYEDGACVAGTTDDSENSFTNNIVVADSGVNSIPFRVDFCSSYIRIAGNIIVGDGATSATHPAIEVDGGTNMGVGVMIEDNLCYNFLAPTTGADIGVFSNKGTDGDIVNNRGFGCSTPLVGTFNVSPTTIVERNDTGTGIDTFTSPATFSAATVLNGALSGTGLTNYFASPPAIGGTAPAAVSSTSGALNGTLGQTTPAAASTTSLTTQPTAAATTDAGNVASTSLQGAIPVVIAGSGYIDATGNYIIGGTPSSSATVSFSATSGSVTATFSAATLVGSASDNGRVIVVRDTTYKICTITAFSSTTVATCTLGATLSGTGPFSNANTYLTGETASNTVNFPVPLRIAYANAYFYVPASSAVGVAEKVFGQCTSIAVCVLYNNVLSSGTPTVPGSLTAFSGLTAGAFTQSTSIQVALSYTVAANVLGNNGSIGFDFDVTQSNDNNSKTATVLYGANGCAVAATTIFTVRLKGDITESGTNASQICVLNPINTTAVQNLQNNTISDTSSHPATINLTLANQYSFAAVERYAIVLKPN
jgi:hypothetical protein